MAIHPTVVRQLTSDAKGNPRWEAEVKGREHEVVTINGGPGLFCRTCQIGSCVGVKAVRPHAVKVRDA